VPVHPHSPPTHTHTRTHRNVYLLLFHRNSGFANAPQCYVIHALPVLLHRVAVAASRPCQYSCFTHLTPTLYNLINWQRRQTTYVTIMHVTCITQLFVLNSSASKATCSHLCRLHSSVTFLFGPRILISSLNAWLVI
jgi:hypothetical protein